jgi:hypothetical protein
MGEGRFNRITLDPGIGADIPFGTDVFIYAELRGIISITDYPTEYLLYNRRVPVPINIGVGFRVLFD